jgi:leucyl aminopeptidase
MYKSITIGRPGSGSSIRVVLIATQTKRLPENLPDRSAALAALKRLDFWKEPGELVFVSPKLVLVGVGSNQELDTTRFRRIGAGMVHGLERMKAARVVLDLETLPSKHAEDPALARALAEGMVTANWRMDLFDGAASKQEPASGKLTVINSSQPFSDGLRKGLILGNNMNFTRRLAATPPNICTPAYVANVARSVARQHDELSCSVITYPQARRMGMGGLENVGKGSANKPCMIILDWKPSKAKSKERLALVGKTITYDTGGYSMSRHAWHEVRQERWHGRPRSDEGHRGGSTSRSGDRTPSSGREHGVFGELSTGRHHQHVQRSDG